MMKRKLENSFKMNPAYSKNRKPGRYISDPKLLPRIREYLSTEGSQMKTVSIPVLADYLQNQFPEYSRRKKGAFQRLVDQAYDMIIGSDTDSDHLSEEEFLDPGPKKKKKNKEARDSRNKEEEGEEEEFSDDPTKYVTYKDRNSMNSMMANMYKKTPKRENKPQILETKMENSGTKSKNEPILKKQTKLELEQTSENFYLDRGGNFSTVKGLIPLQSVDAVAPVESVSSVHSSNVEFAEDGTCLEKDVAEVDGFLEDAGSLPSNQSPEKRKRKQKKIGSSSKYKMKVDEDDRKKRSEPVVQKSTITFADVGGNEENLKEICKLLVHMRHPEVYQQLGVTPPRGFLLHGPPGCGKTLLANAIAGELDLPFIKIAATEIVSGVSGDSEEKVRDLFDKAGKCAPCIMFIDEIDAITQKRETASKDMERRIVAQLLTCMDDLNTGQSAHVLVIGATNRPDSLDPALRRAGRFDREICLGIPDEAARLRIIKVLSRNLRLTPDFDFGNLAHNTPGFVGADLMALTREAAMVAVNRIFKELQVFSGSVNKEINSGEDNPVTDAEQSCVSCPADSGNRTLCRKQTLDTDSSERCTLPSDHNGLQPLIQTEVTSDNLSAASVTENVKHKFPLGETVENELGQRVNVKGQANGEKTQADVADAIVKHSSGMSVECIGGQLEDLNTVLLWLKEHPPLTEEQLKDLYIGMEDFKEALKHVQPSAKREGFATIPDVTWDDVGALHDVREELQLAILAPVKYAKEFQNLGLNRAQGILLAGPPGCGKTLLAKAVANESGINFISVKGPELLNMYVGESERGVRQVFQRARNSAPCVIFFDELDALCPRRSDAREGGSSVRVVNQLLTEMDGLEERKQVFIMAATNRPDIIDPAVLRPGRLDKTLYVGLPSQTDRLDILKTITKNGSRPLLHEDVSLGDVAKDTRCDGYTGADLAALVREASVCALKEVISGKGRSLQETVVVKNSHFEMAFDRIRPSVSAKDQAKYQNMHKNLVS